MQVNAYLDNTIDVKALLEDSDTKNAALERVAELEEALSYVSYFRRVCPCVDCLLCVGMINCAAVFLYSKLCGWASCRR